MCRVESLFDIFVSRSVIIWKLKYTRTLKLKDVGWTHLAELWSFEYKFWVRFLCSIQIIIYELYYA